MIAGRPKLNVRAVAAPTVGEPRKPMANADLVYVMDGEVACMVPDEGDIFSNPFANFTEWDSEEDEKGFANL